MGSSSCHAENRTTVKSFSSCRSVPEHFTNELCAFSQSMAYKILSKDRVETNKNVKREREREGEREGYGERGEGERGRERERERERRGKGRVMYTICAPFATLFSEKGGVQRRQIQVKIHIKTIEEEKELNRYYNSTYRTIRPTSRLVTSAAMNLHGHCKCSCQSKSS